MGDVDVQYSLQGTLLAQALYRYLGPALLPSLADLKPVQQKELGEGFAQLDSAGEGAGTGKATRLTRREKRVEEERAAAGTGNAEDEAGELNMSWPAQCVGG
jgi:cytoskeleton-associated protein 5